MSCITEESGGEAMTLPAMPVGSWSRLKELQKTALWHG
jgi:hypothetical protein